MNVEGKGARTPAPIPVRLRPWRLGELFDLARRREAARNYAASAGWRRGLTDNPTFRGLVGEEACALWLSSELGASLRIDEEDRPRGDGGTDLRYGGFAMQVKCRKRHGDAVMVRRQDDRGRVVPFPADAFVQATWGWEFADDDRGRPLLAEAAAVPVLIDGWLSRDDVLGGRLCPARKGSHVNLELGNDDLRGADDLLLLLLGLRDAGREGSHE